MSVLTCPSCKTPAPIGSMFCDNCGYDLRSVPLAAPQPVMPTYRAEPGGGPTCRSCGQANLEGSMFCENCGAKLEATPVVAPPVAPPVQPSPPPPPANIVPEKPAPIQPPVAPASAPAAQPPVVAMAGISGRILIQSANVSLNIPQGKTVILIGREDPVSGIFPEIDLDPYGGQEAGVGRKHAQMTVNAGQVFIEDLDSVNGTVLNRQRLTPRQPQPVKNGDEIRIGKLVLTYYNS
jgi:pSer/pThr/pTyr-binding forkhead associated (FHA) protein